jgi:hypothetical protein
MKNQLLLGIVLLSAIGYCLILLFHIPLFQNLSDWFWRFTDTPQASLWLVFPLLVISAIVIAVILQRPERHKLNLSLLIILGYCLQMGFGFSEGRGLDGLRDHMVNRGHSDFISVALAHPEPLKVARNYEDLASQDELGQYPQAKPPGALLVYIITQKVSALFFAANSDQEKIQTVATFAAFVYPLLTYLVIIPLFFFCRLFLPVKVVLMACALFIFTPNVTLITMHLDQALYPLLFMTTLYLWSQAFLACNYPMAVLAGMVAYISLFVTFSLLPVMPLGILVLLAFFGENKNAPRKLFSLIKIIGLFAIGYLICDVLARLLFNYDIMLRYENAMTFHRAWKTWIPGTRFTLYFAFLNYLEFACWTGFPLAILFLANSSRAVLGIARKNLNTENIFSISLIVILFMLGFFGKTKNETGRLWIFLIPFACALIAYEIQSRYDTKSNLVFKLILVSQFAIIACSKFNQDS